MKTPCWNLSASKGFLHSRGMMAQRFLSVKNFDQYQHFKKSNPPWIKLYRSLFTDREFMQLPVSCKYLYIGIVMLASEGSNRVPHDLQWISQRLSISLSEIDLKPLYKAGFFIASESTVYRETISQRRDREETETEERREEDAATASPSLVEVLVNLWNQIPGVVPSKAVTGPIKKRLLSRLSEHPDLVWWTTYFDRIKDSAFLTGRKTDFAATLDWVLGPKNMAKILAGNYDTRAPVVKESAMMEQARAFLGRG